MWKKLCSFIFVLGLSSQAHCLTLSNIRNQIRRHIRDTATDSSLRQYSDTTLNAQINEVQREVVNITWPLNKRTSFTLVSGTTYYSCPTDMIVPKAVYYTGPTGQTYELQEALEQSYRKSNPDYERQRGPPAVYFIRTSTFSNTQQEISFSPVPTTTSTGTVKMDYFNSATDLSSDTDVPFNGLYVLYQYHDSLVYDSVAKIKLIEGDVTAAQSYFQLFQNMVNQMLSKLGSAPNYTPGVIAGSGSSGTSGR